MDGEVEFETSSFSIFTIAGMEYSADDNHLFYYNTAYGTAFSTGFKFNKNRSEKRRWNNEILEYKLTIGDSKLTKSSRNTYHFKVVW